MGKGEFIMTETTKGYYDIDTDLEAILTDGGMINELFYLKDLQQRKLFLKTDIDSFSVADVVKHIMQINKEDREIPAEERKPILLYLSSHGGSVDAGFELIDAIKMSKTPVYTINLGYWYSMGFFIGIAGDKRFATQNSTFLMHDGSSFVIDSSAKVQDRMDFQKRLGDRIKEYVISNSNVTSEEYDSKFRTEWYLFAPEAKEKGFIDYIIGEDCGIDEII